MYSYSERRKRSVKIKNMKNLFEIILSGVFQWSIFELFNIFLNDLFLSIKKSDLFSFADDNTISAFCKDLDPLTYTLTEESENAFVWLHKNDVIVNPSKFQGLIVNRLGKFENTYIFSSNNKQAR